MKDGYFSKLANSGFFKQRSLGQAREVVNIVGLQGQPVPDTLSPFALLYALDTMINIVNDIRTIKLDPHPKNLPYVEAIDSITFTTLLIRQPCTEDYYCSSSTSPSATSSNGGTRTYIEAEAEANRDGTPDSQT